MLESMPVLLISVVQNEVIKKTYYSLQQQKVKSIKSYTTITQLVVVCSVCSTCTYAVNQKLLVATVTHAALYASASGLARCSKTTVKSMLPRTSKNENRPIGPILSLNSHHIN